MYQAPATLRRDDAAGLATFEVSNSDVLEDREEGHPDTPREQPNRCR